MTNGLSASDYVRGIISDCEQTLYALRALRAHGMSDVALQAIYKSVVIDSKTLAFVCELCG